MNLKIAELSKKLNDLENKTFKLLESSGNKDEIEKIKEELEDLRDRKDIKISFVGQYSSGKSTIISALTGNKDIKIDSNVATDEVSEYRWNNIILMDTPGILAGKVEEHDSKTKEALKDSDLIVYVITSQLFDDIIFENFIDLAYKQNFKDKMLIAINKMSMENGDFNELEKNYLTSLKNIFKEKGYDFDFNVVFIDAADYLEGMDEGDDDFIQLSNFNNFISSLNLFVEEKGLIKKQFDTPIRVLKNYISNLALSDIDPNLQKQAEYFSNRIKNSLRNLQNQIRLKLSDFELENNNKAYETIINYVGEISEIELENKISTYQNEVTHDINRVSHEIEEIVDESYSQLVDDIGEFSKSDAIVLFEQNLELKLNTPNISTNEKQSLINQRKFLDFITSKSDYVAQISGVNSINGVAQSSGSQLHTIVYKTGKFFGHKFRPWGAVKTASKIGKAAKFGVPVLTAGLTFYLDFKESKKEDERIKKIETAKRQIFNDLKTYVKKLSNGIEKSIDENVFSNFKNKLYEADQMKIQLIETAKSNDKLKSDLLELDAEYIDFIEIIEENK
ncbi:GTPase [Ornithobacterium rhinotracheale]|uniref:GTPase n=1 Tax=Ornithobacterium rhinotracheale TaxID=28251 RepID=UPI00129CD66B|nr:GTPase [Ornithobacterium rhinotracheale]MRI62703.1 GTPase [Ornithobacterium rhinotracheale]